MTFSYPSPGKRAAGGGPQKGAWWLVQVAAVLLLLGAFVVVCWVPPTPAGTPEVPEHMAPTIDVTTGLTGSGKSTARITVDLSVLREQAAMAVAQESRKASRGENAVVNAPLGRMRESVPAAAFKNPSVPSHAHMKIYVYDMPTKFTDWVLVRNPHCEKEAFGTEIHIHQQMLRSKYRTLNPDDADLFYVPVYAACMVYTNFLHFPAYRRLISDSLQHVIQNYPYWNRTKGQDHVYAFVHDYGGCLSWFDNLDHIYFKALQNSIFLSHLGDLSMGCFSPHKDIVIPPMSANEQVYRLGRGGATRDINDPQPVVVAAGGEGGKTSATAAPVPKPIFAYFRGTIKWYHMNDIPELKITRGYSKSYSKGIRLRIQQLYAADPLFFINEGPSPDYVGEVRNSTFCLCPRGFAPWSQRLYDSIMLGCIPVIIADDIVLPWEDIVDYRSFSVKVDERDLPRLKHILLSVSPASIASKQAQLRTVYKMFSYQRPSEPGDAFDMLMQRLSQKALRHRPAGPDAWK